MLLVRGSMDLSQGAIEERWTHLHSGSLSGHSPASMRNFWRPPMRCGESESVVEMVPV